MAKTAGLGDRLLVDGYDLSGDVGSLEEIRGGPAPIEFTHLTKSAVERIGGRFDGAIGWTSFFNPGGGGSYMSTYTDVYTPDIGGGHVVLSTLPTASRAVTYLRGTTLGDPGAGLLAKQIGYDGKRGGDGAFTLGVAAQGSDGYPLEWGVQGTAGLRTDTTATNGTGVDAGASSASGLVAYLHVGAVTGTSVTVKVQSSSDNGVADTWADLLSFTAATPAGAPTAQRASVTGSVERYLRVVTTGTFTLAQFSVLLCRPADTVADPYPSDYASSY